MTFLPVNALWFFGVSLYVEYMNNFEIMLASINAFVIVPAVVIIHQANFEQLRYLAYGRDEEIKQQ